MLYSKKCKNCHSRNALCKATLNLIAPLLFIYCLFSHSQQLTRFKIFQFCCCISRVDRIIVFLLHSKFWWCCNKPHHFIQLPEKNNNGTLVKLSPSWSFSRLFWTLHLIFLFKRVLSDFAVWIALAFRHGRLSRFNYNRHRSSCLFSC